MLWFVLALVGALFMSFYDVLIKKIVKDMDVYALGAYTLLIGAFFAFIISFANGLPHINRTFVYAALLTSFINSIALVLYYKALKATDISLVIPFSSLTPLFLILTSYLILGEQPTLAGTLGIIFVVFGAYTISFRKKEGMLMPFKEFFKNRGIFLMICAAALWGISVNFYKMTIINSDPLFSIFAIYLLIGAILLPCSIFRNRLKKSRFVLKKNIKLLVSVAAIALVSDIAMAFALSQQIAPYVISIKRTSILFSVFFGMLLFKERHFVHRFVSALIILTGIILIVLTG